MTSGNAKYGPLARGIRRDLSEKGWVPVRFWVVWWTSLAVAMVVFYVVLTPIWLGLRAAAWVAELRSRALGPRPVVGAIEGRDRVLAARPRSPRLHRPEERVDLRLRAEARDPEAGELARVALPTPGLVPERVREERARAREDASQRLAVSVPQLLAARHAEERAAHEAWEPDTARKIQPDDRVGALEHEVAELPAVVAVDHPPVPGDDRLDAPAELGSVQLGPPGLPVDRVELDVRHGQGRRERAADRGLPASAGGGDDRDAAHVGKF